MLCFMARWNFSCIRWNARASAELERGRKQFWREHYSSNPAENPASYWPDWQGNLNPWEFSHCLQSGQEFGRIVTWQWYLLLFFSLGTMYQRFFVSFSLAQLGSECCFFSKFFWAFGRVYVCFGSVVPARVGQAVRQTLWFALWGGGAVIADIRACFAWSLDEVSLGRGLI